MKWSLMVACFSVALLIFLFSPAATAQEMVYNGDFATGSYNDGWTLFGGNQYTQMAVFQVTYGDTSWCLKRRPGPPNSNGGIETTVGLLGGVTYSFSANIAAEYCSS